MAGHIDHGKTTLTKALTGIDTDRLQEEKRRNISIEPGYALLVQNKAVQISIIDVPGHERFIRQMIAGIAGIDYVVLVIAGDEGVMPQTREHLHILTLLGITHGAIVVTKTEGVDEDLLFLVHEDIKNLVTNTFLETSPVFYVDSVTNHGMTSLKQFLIEDVQRVGQRKTYPSFRMPIDQVFTVKGQGVVVRGTIFDGSVAQEDELTILPNGIKARVRQIQSHYTKKERVYAGQRAAINVGGVSVRDLKRGDVLVKDQFYTVTKRIDLVFQPLQSIQHKIKQRQTIKINIGTAEVTGKIIFFDRNELHKEFDEVFCQIQVDEPIVATRGDRLILRRASPAETVGGGFIIDPRAERHRFGQQTIEKLQQLKEGTPKERVLHIIAEDDIRTKEQLLKQAAITEEQFAQIEDEFFLLNKKFYTTMEKIKECTQKMNDMLINYHATYPLRAGMDKAQLLSQLTPIYKRELVEGVLQINESKQHITICNQFIAQSIFKRHVPKEWTKRIESFIKDLQNSGAEVGKYVDLCEKQMIPKQLQTDLYYFLIETGKAYALDEERMISKEAVCHLKELLYKKTKGDPFNLQRARDILQLSRKNLIPLLELFDELQYTRRVENERKWLI